MANKELIKAIQKHINDFGFASFDEIKTICEEIGVEYKGDKMLHPYSNTTVFIENNISQTVIDTLTDLVENYPYGCQPATGITFLMLGHFYDNCKIAKNPQHQYKGLRWLPTIIVKE